MDAFLESIASFSSLAILSSGLSFPFVLTVSCATPATCTRFGIHDSPGLFKGLLEHVARLSRQGIKSDFAMTQAGTPQLGFEHSDRLLDFFMSRFAALPGECLVLDIRHFLDELPVKGSVPSGLYVDLFGDSIIVVLVHQLLYVWVGDVRDTEWGVVVHELLAVENVTPTEGAALEVRQKLLLELSWRASTHFDMFASSPSRSSSSSTSAAPSSSSPSS